MIEPAQRIILLDFDGAVKADVREPSGTERNRLRGYPVEFDDGVQVVMWIDPSVAEKLATIADLPGVTVFWLSANGWLVPEIIAPAVGLPQWGIPMHAPRHQMPGIPMHGIGATFWWKTQVALEYLESNDSAQVLWIDDRIAADLQQHLRGYEPASRLSWIVPDGRRGLNSVGLDLIERWALDGRQVRRDLVHRR